ncbi:MAG: sigma-54-dependent Fis family transcriptional regulator, partial [Deltaproteobacteria bacterium]|nr:sigma-54-dependent Fis family transcriptional regulator [Deltaproteobacteria bacterium]
VLEEKTVIRIGAREPIVVAFRLISATSRDLGIAVAENEFREDFFYRINVITIDVPPLRKRKEDIPLLVEHFLDKYSHETTKRVDHTTAEAIRLLKEYDWPGNVRELENAIERAVVLSKSRTLGSQDFAFLGTAHPPTSKPRSLREMERNYIQETLENCDWNVTRASKILDINRVTLHKMIKRFDLKRP